MEGRSARRRRYGTRCTGARRSQIAAFTRDNPGARECPRLGQAVTVVGTAFIWIWLLLALLQNQGQDRQSAAEALRMSYLTSAADVALIPARLGLVSALASTADADLKNLARGDIRLILTRRPDLKPAIANAYRRGWPDGKAYIGGAVQSLDPGFVRIAAIMALRNALLSSNPKYLGTRRVRRYPSSSRAARSPKAI